MFGEEDDLSFEGRIGEMVCLRDTRGISSDEKGRRAFSEKHRVRGGSVVTRQPWGRAVGL